MSKGYKKLSEIKSACKKVDSCATGSDGFMYKCFPYMAEQMTETNNSLKKLTKAIESLNRRISMLEELEGVSLAFKELTEKLEQSKK